MEHEVVVPLPIATVRRALEDRDLIVRSLPGLAVSAERSSLEETYGRLRVRLGGSTITYGGYLSLGEWRDEVLTVFLTGEEMRGEGDVAVQLHISLAEAPQGTLLLCTGELNMRGGRLETFDTATLESLGRRLIEKTTAAMIAELAADDDGDEVTATVVYLEDRSIEQELDDDLSDLIAFPDDEQLPAPEPGELPYEPALAGGPVRRSIVGRSAEEVDHAPPHGRYAPTPPSRSARARAASRWGGVEPTLLSGSLGERSAMPWVIGGGVALIGGAVVLVRVLRRR